MHQSITPFVLIVLALQLDPTIASCNILGLFGSSGAEGLLGGLSECLTSATQLSKNRKPPPIDGALIQKLIGGLGNRIKSKNSQCYVKHDEIYNATLLERMFRGLTDEPRQSAPSGESCFTSNSLQLPMCLNTKDNAIHVQLKDYLKTCERDTMRYKIYTSNWKLNKQGCVMQVNTDSPVWTTRWNLDLDHNDFDLPIVARDTYPCGEDSVYMNRAKLSVARALCLQARTLIRSRCDPAQLPVLADPAERAELQACALANLQYANSEPRTAIERCMCEANSGTKPHRATCVAEQENSPQCVDFTELPTEEKFHISYLAKCLGTSASNQGRSKKFGCMTQEDEENQPETADAFKAAVTTCDQETMKLYVNSDDQCVYKVPGNSDTAWRKNSAVEKRMSAEQLQRSIVDPSFPCEPSLSSNPRQRNANKQLGENNKKMLTVFRTGCRMLLKMLEPSAKCESLCRLNIFRALSPSLIRKEEDKARFESLIGALRKLRPKRKGPKSSGTSVTRPSPQVEAVTRKMLDCTLKRMSNWYTDPTPLLNPKISSSCFAREVDHNC